MNKELEYIPFTFESALLAKMHERLISGEHLVGLSYIGVKGFTLSGSYWPWKHSLFFKFKDTGEICGTQIAEDGKSPIVFEPIEMNAWENKFKDNDEDVDSVVG